MRILHLADRLIWANARQTDGYRQSTRELTLEQEGFLHASTSEQIGGVLGRYYADADLNGYLLLVIDVPSCEAAGSPVRWDPASGSLYPHIYGPLQVDAVVAELPVGRDSSGEPVLPDLTGLDVAAGPAAGG